MLRRGELTASKLLDRKFVFSGHDLIRFAYGALAQRCGNHLADCQWLSRTG